MFKLLLVSFKVLAVVVQPIGRLLYGLKIEGMENIPKEGPFVLTLDEAGPMANLLSIVTVVDVMAKSCLLGTDFWLMNRWTAWFWRRLSEEPNFFSVSHFQRGLSFSSLMGALVCLQEGKPVVIAGPAEFPWDGSLLLPRAGGAWLALRAGVPVVAVVQKGGYDIWPRWAKRPKLTGKCTIRVSKPFYLGDAPRERVTKEMVRRGQERIKREMAALLEE